MSEGSVVRINHGKVFGKNNGNWYTFHCPECNSTLTDNTVTMCSKCGPKLNWKGANAL